MMARTEYERSESDMSELLDACKPVTVMMVGSFPPASPQENANNAWARLGTKMDFDGATVRPMQGKGQRFFTAIPRETDATRDERLAREASGKQAVEIATLEAEIAERKTRLAALT